MKIGIVRTNLDCAAKFAFRLGRALKVKQCIAAIVECVGVAWMTRQNPIVVRQSLIETAEILESIATIVDEAASRWPLTAATVIHRVGTLLPSDQIVLVAVASAHRHDSFAACEFIMDFLKTRAPFWKKEVTGEGERWVDARSSDDEAAERW